MMAQTFGICSATSPGVPEDTHAYRAAHGHGDPEADPEDLQ